MAKLRIEDLKRIQEEVKGTVNLRDGHYRVKVTVHMGTCGIAAGARPVMSMLLRLISEGGVQDVILTSSGCAGLCSHEPMMTVEVQEQAPVKYTRLDAQKAERIFAGHVMGGKPVAELAFAEGSETTG
ncbi:MAG: (2Fe-2S) ferredoxin domain-containing protein [Candidatus Eisenbacteria bacterium]|uniref:(2Fe-2S) ferredoxin domain-containing protein n=1 Tax=Eiseniibacteriota bacterium TaxID=2212470 RepID=A0A937XAM3_UNCEI|nr:(2Fe-2S) ferredoxin domain-containing protein [Candidatus Eisenbacteria bacterium]